MKKRKRVSITLIIIVVVITTISLSIALFYGYINTTINELHLNEAERNNEEIANNAVQYFESKLNEQISVIKSLEINHHNIDVENDIFDDDYYETILSLNPSLNAVEIFNNDGLILYSSLIDENRIGINISQNDIISQVENHHELIIGSLVYSSSLNELSLEIVYSGEEYSIYSLISVDYLKAYGEEYKVSFDNKEILIIDEHGKFLYDSVDSNHLIRGRYQDFENIQEQLEEGFSGLGEINDDRVVVSMNKLTLTPGFIIIYEDIDSALLIGKSTQKLYIIGFTIIFSIIIAMFVYLLIKIVNELKYAASSFVTIGEGNFGNLLPPSRIKEFNELRMSLNKSNTNLDELTDKLENLAFYDTLTGLGTRNKASIDFKKYKSDQNISFLYIDVDRFAVINENYSFSLGDKALKAIGEKLKDHCENVYRVEGDEYLILYELHGKNDLVNIIAKLQKSISKGFLIEGLQINISIKIGVSIFPKNGTEFNELFQKSIIALHDYISKGEIAYVPYDDERNDLYLRNSKIEILLNQAIENQEFYTVFQPIVYAKDKSIRGYEALTRWVSSELGTVYPDEFIPILERTRKIHLLDKKVLNDSIKLNKFIQSEYNLFIVSSVNISVDTLMRDDFVRMIEETIEKFDYDPNLLELEITESTIVKDFDKITLKMNQLRMHGVKFSEDDFGDAYSSLTYLTKLKIDTLKISKNFLSSILDNVENRVLVQTILGLSKRLGFSTIVEGIEDEKTFELLKSYGCDFIQGFLFYKPMKEEALLDVLKKSIKKE